MGNDMNDKNKRLQLDTPVQWPRKVAVMGAARSGIAVVRYFNSKGIPVFLSDTCSQEALTGIAEKNRLDISGFEATAHTDKILDADLIVLSPGIESDLPVLKEARRRNIPVWSEMELGFQASRAPFYAVTGSTGKSTTVSMAGAALASAKIEHTVAGNIGVPVITAAPGISETGAVIAEVSSFQLETIECFSPRIAVVMNLMKNHLDRYRDEDDYYNAKKNIARNLDKEQFLVLNAHDAHLRRWGEEMAEKTRVVYFGENVSGADALWYEGKTLFERIEEHTELIGDFSSMRLPGTHNLENAAVAAFMARQAGASVSDLVKGITTFKGLPHRLEFVMEKDGVTFFNDSKSTTAESVACAVDAFKGGVHLIAGGKDKGCDFSVVTSLLKRKTKSITLIGEAAERISDEWKNTAPLQIANSLEEAVQTAASKAVHDNVVVFSPGCSSFDMFKNYEDRGEQFRTLVYKLTGDGDHDK
jgi:UDP-N-acetylmuramoylalanine--D-glutamate ligase